MQRVALLRRPGTTLILIRATGAPDQQRTTPLRGLLRRIRGTRAARSAYFARLSASQTPPPIMKPPEIRDSSRVRRDENIVRARPASSA